MPGETGEIFSMGDSTGLAAALERIRGCRRRGGDSSFACRTRVAEYSVERATAGLLSACRAVIGRRR
jgi:hypothetical protein